MANKEDHENIPKLKANYAELKNLQDILDDALDGNVALSKNQLKTLQACLNFTIWLYSILTLKGVSVSWLRRLLGVNIPKNNCSNTSPDKNKPEDKNPNLEEPNLKDSSETIPDGNDLPSPNTKKKKKDRQSLQPRNINVSVHIPNPLEKGSLCPKCQEGKLYPFRRDGKNRTILVVVFSAPFQVAEYEMEDLRCRSCDYVAKAPLPEKLKNEGIDPDYQGGGGRGIVIGDSARVALAFLHYFAGLPFARTEKLQELFGQTLARQTQWNICRHLAEGLVKMLEFIRAYIALCSLIQTDDTSNRIHELGAQIKEKRSDGSLTLRDGCHSTIVLGVDDKKRVLPLITTGIHHAGEVLDDILKHRPDDLSKPITVVDLSKVNEVYECDATLSACLQHARDRFIKLEKLDINLGAECLSQMKKVFLADKGTHNLPPEERLARLQKNGLPHLENLYKICSKARDNYPNNSEIYKLLNYFVANFQHFIIPFNIEGLPLTNNLSEWCTYIVARYRANSKGYKNIKGAKTGDIIQTLVLTALLSGRNPYQYLFYLHQNRFDLENNPESYLPWEISEGIVQPLTARVRMNFSIPNQPRNTN